MSVQKTAKDADTLNSDHQEILRENKSRNYSWKKKGRNVSFDECVHVLTKCAIIEMPLKNSMFGENMSSTCCKCRNGILKDDEVNKDHRKSVKFEREELLRTAILNRDLPEFEEVCQHWEMNFNKKLSNGLALIHLASISGSLRILQVILKFGGKVDEPDNLGWTAFHYAVLHDHVPCALALLQAGADIGARTADYRTAIELATEDEMLLLLGRAMNRVTIKASLDENKETYV